MGGPEIDLEAARRDPSAVFARPRDVLTAPGLSRDEKLQVLRRWEYDAREMAVAEEENMSGGEPDLLAEVAEALAHLDGSSDHEHSAPTKQGGE